MGFISHHITPLVINSLGGEHTLTHTDDLHSINFKKPGGPACDRRTPGLKTAVHKLKLCFNEKYQLELVTESPAAVNQLIHRL